MSLFIVSCILIEKINKMKKIVLGFFMTVTLSLFAQKKTTHTYAVKDGERLKLDIYTPKNLKKTDTLPVLLWMHGGSFSGGSRASQDDNNLVKYVANEQNFIGVSIDYRLLRKGVASGFGCDCTKDEKLETFKQAATDYLDAAKFLVDNYKKFQIDTTKIIAGGSSAGAEGVLNAVFMRDYFLSNKEAYADVSFAGVFSCAGALVDADYITETNAIPAVLYHGTDDRLVPFSNAPHHYCEPIRDGYLILDGSKVVTDKLEEYNTSFYFNIVKGGGHEISAIPFYDLEKIFEFFERTVLNEEFIQTKVVKTKK